jgi:hypothetical protein
LAATLFATGLRADDNEVVRPVKRAFLGGNDRVGATPPPGYVLGHVDAGRIPGDSVAGVTVHRVHPLFGVGLKTSATLRRPIRQPIEQLGHHLKSASQRPTATTKQTAQQRIYRHTARYQRAQGAIIDKLSSVRWSG